MVFVSYPKGTFVPAVQENIFVMSVDREYFVSCRLASRDRENTKERQSLCNECTDDNSLTSTVSAVNQKSRQSKTATITRRLELNNGVDTQKANCSPFPSLPVTDIRKTTPIKIKSIQKSDVFPVFPNVNISTKVAGNNAPKSVERRHISHKSTFNDHRIDTTLASYKVPCLFKHEEMSKNKKIVVDVCNKKKENLVPKSQWINKKTRSAKGSDEAANVDYYGNFPKSTNIYVPNWFYGSSNTTGTEISIPLDHHLNPASSTEKVNNDFGREDQFTNETNHDQLSNPTNSGNVHVKEDNRLDNLINGDCSYQSMHRPCQGSCNWRTLPMESDLDKYLRLIKGNKARSMSFSSYVRPVDTDKHKFDKTNWQPKQEYTSPGLFEKQKNRFGHKNLYKHRESVCMQLQSQRDRTYGLQSKMKTIIQDK